MNELSKPQHQLNISTIENVLLKGDLSSLTNEQRVSYYMKVCESVGLNYLTQPFSYIELNRKLVLYATRAATEQLRKVHKVSLAIKTRETLGDVYVVTAQATLPNGRQDESTGAVCILGLKGDALANAYLKAETKAKRRVTLSICGLALLDETEVETIPDAKKPTAEDIMSGKVEPPEYTVPFGKYKDLKIEEIGEDNLKVYISYIMEKAEKQGNQIEGQVKEFLEHGKGYLEELAMNREMKDKIGDLGDFENFK